MKSPLFPLITLFPYPSIVLFPNITYYALRMLDSCVAQPRGHDIQQGGDDGYLIYLYY